MFLSVRRQGDLFKLFKTSTQHIAARIAIANAPLELTGRIPAAGTATENKIRPTTAPLLSYH